jgi:hypothetical protein
MLLLILHSYKKEFRPKEGKVKKLKINLNKFVAMLIMILIVLSTNLVTCM